MEVEGITFTTESKQYLMRSLASAIWNERVFYPEEGLIVDELKAFEYEEAKNGAYLYQPSEGWTDDCVDSLALAADRINRPMAVPWSSV